MMVITWTTNIDPNFPNEDPLRWRHEFETCYIWLKSWTGSVQAELSDSSHSLGPHIEVPHFLLSSWPDQAQVYFGLRLSCRFPTSTLVPDLELVDHRIEPQSSGPVAIFPHLACPGSQAQSLPSPQPQWVALPIRDGAVPALS